MTITGSTTIFIRAFSTYIAPSHIITYAINGISHLTTNQVFFVERKKEQEVMGVVSKEVVQEASTQYFPQEVAK
jgi:hypothetical protein